MVVSGVAGHLQGNVVCSVFEVDRVVTVSIPPTDLKYFVQVRHVLAGI